MEEKSTCKIYNGSHLTTDFIEIPSEYTCTISTSGLSKEFLHTT